MKWQQEALTPNPLCQQRKVVCSANYYCCRMSFFGPRSWRSVPWYRSDSNSQHSPASQGLYSIYFPKTVAECLSATVMSTGSTQFSRQHSITAEDDRQAHLRAKTSLELWCTGLLVCQELLSLVSILLLIRLAYAQPSATWHPSEQLISVRKTARLKGRYFETAAVVLPTLPPVLSLSNRPARLYTGAGSARTD